MVIAIWSGEGKPNAVNEFLQPFVNELLELMRDGISTNSHNFQISVRAFICDSPARAYIKGSSDFLEI